MPRATMPQHTMTTRVTLLAFGLASLCACASSDAEGDDQREFIELAPKPPRGEGAAGAPPPDGGDCGEIDGFGTCHGTIAYWCEGGVLRSLDCAPLRRMCEWIDDKTGYYCSDNLYEPPDDSPPRAPRPPGEAPERPGDPGAPPPPDDPGAPPPPDNPGDPPPPPPDNPGAPPPPDDPGAPPPPDNPAPPPPNDPAPPPPNNPQPPADGCGGISYEGQCEGNVAVWCSSGQLARRDCAAFGQTCGYVNDEIGFYCRDGGGAPPPPDGPAPPPPPPPDNDPAPPPPDPGAPPPPPDPGAPPPPPDDPGAPPPPGGGCGDIDYFGVCDGPVVIYCLDDTLVAHDCAQFGQTCGWTNDQDGNWCVAH